jgi:hypothetical protein
MRYTLDLNDDHTNDQINTSRPPQYIDLNSEKTTSHNDMGFAGRA